MERVILANEALAEIRFLDYDIDLDLGDTNDFVIYIPYPEWDGVLKPRMFAYVPGTEYGGIIRSISGNTKEDQVQVTGTTWRHGGGCWPSALSVLLQEMTTLPYRAI